MLKQKNPFLLNKPRRRVGKALAFTQRERQCLEYLAKNESILQIATNLHITKHTLSFYLRNILYKNRLLTENMLSQSTSPATTSRFKPNIQAQISHELRNPLAGIAGIVHFLEKTPLTIQQKAYLSVMEQCTQQLLSAEAKIHSLFSSQEIYHDNNF